ncbi:MAG: hypothetical protein HC889_00450 [Synechococcaceae cyanobacterium SM1_2_3]|nr:hypothetical protein [Synechococcaceae cyanobacterium SM1_2_3]
MIEQILLGNSSLAGVREIGGFGQPLHLLYPQIRAVLTNELGPEAATIFAEPVVDRVGNRIDWYTQGDPDQPPSPFNALPDHQRQAVGSQIDDFLRRGCDLAERYVASADPRRVQLGALLQAVLHPPAESDVFLVHDQPVIIGWAFARDRPWDMAANPVRSPASPVHQLAAAPHDVAIPDMAIPELTSAAAPESASLPGAEPASSAPQPELPPPLPPPPVPPQEPITPSVAPLPLPSQEMMPTAIPVDPMPESVAAQQEEGGKSSSWLWWLIALIVLLALFAAYWLMQDRTQSVAPERAATQQAQLDAVPPPSPDSSARIAPRSASPGSTSAVAVKPAIPVDAMLSPRPDGISSLPVSPAPMSEAGSKQAAAMPPATGERRVERTIAADDAAGELKTASQPLPTRASSTATAPLAAAEPSLEQALSGRESKPPAASKSPLPPIKAEPTSEERREFASRMSATGAGTGEITATLLWNSPSDLDLLVRCPSGQQLDYRSPAECGGALDVDANAARASLSARPVENAFWPAGKAAPGNYEIAVRYAPRKDEQNPQETPFQVRLIRDDQESVFKGVVRPNTVTSVTTFRVER